MNDIIFSVDKKDIPFIFSGKKTALIAKKRPKEISFPTRVLIYEKKGRLRNLKHIAYTAYGYDGRGMIVGECVCDSIEQGDCYKMFEMSNRLRMTSKEICDYLMGGDGYAFKIRDAKPYDEEISLADLGKETPPQAWYFVESRRGRPKNDTKRKIG
jgi:predicted transcriptional regulator